MLEYFDKIVRGTEHEDALVIIQQLKGMIGKSFSFLNYYKEMPVSYDATLVSIENEMAEFQIHEYQAKSINIERKVLIFCPEKSAFKDDIVGEAFYVNVAKKRVILCKFGYAKIRSDMRRFVRVVLDRPVGIDLVLEHDLVSGTIKDLSLGGAAMSVVSPEMLIPGQDINCIINLLDLTNNTVVEVGLTATVVRIFDDQSPCICLLEFHPEKHSQQQIAYFINQRQVEIIKELKELNN